MIAANELRLGNWVYSPEEENVMIETIDDTWCKVRNKGDDEFHESYGCPTINLNPISLTPEILEKCGFKPFVNDWQIKGIILHNRKRGFVINKKIPIVKNLHQLQNLYYSLTGKELGVNM